MDIVEEIWQADPDLKTFLIRRFSEFTGNRDFIEALSGYLLPDEASQAISQGILERMKLIVAGHISH